MNEHEETVSEDSQHAEKHRVASLPCPYCGEANASDTYECGTCAGIFEPLSRQATQNAMGPWFVRDEDSPFAPGCSYETLRKLVKRGRIVATTVVRGPTTNQFWMQAKNTPGVAILMSLCHSCHEHAKPEDFSCEKCGSVLSPATSRDGLGLAPVASVNRSPIAPKQTVSPTREALNSLTLGGFTPITSPSDARNSSSVPTTLSNYLTSAKPAPGERPPRPAAPKQGAKNAPRRGRATSGSTQPTQQQATTRRLRSQLRSTKTMNLMLIVLCALLAVSLVLVFTLPNILAPAPAAQEAPAQSAAMSASATISEEASAPAPQRIVEPTDERIEAARTLANDGTEASIQSAITLLNDLKIELNAAENQPGGLLEIIEEDLKAFNEQLDELRLSRMLSDP